MKKLVLLAFVTLALAGCAGSSSGSASSVGKISAEEKAVRQNSDYWQRADSVSAQYMTGPKAQHQLNMDIAACVAEVKELVRLGSIRKAEPPKDLAMEPGLRAGWYSPTRDGPLYTEYTDFQDFDGCMKSKGWERVDFVKPIAARRASRNYVTTILGHPFGWGASSASSTSADESQDNSFNN